MVIQYKTRESKLYFAMTLASTFWSSNQSFEIAYPPSTKDLVIKSGTSLFGKKTVLFRKQFEQKLALLLFILIKAHCLHKILGTRS